MYPPKVCFQEFSYFASGLNNQIEQSKNNSPVRKKSVAVGEIHKVIHHFFEHLIRTNGLVVKVSCRESGDLGSIPDEC